MKLITLILTFALLLAAADKPIVGAWKAVTDSPDGEQYTWTVVVKEEDGKLTGTMTGGPGQFPLVDAKLDGDLFTFKVVVEEQTYAIEVKVAGTAIEGTWKGPGSKGFIKGTKQS
ncbi:MAG: hypothetical protein AAB225_29230 [Acidobacteriota bacterium]